MLNIPRNRKKALSLEKKIEFGEEPSSICNLINPTRRKNSERDFSFG
jgi:hypothetical protein